MSEVLSLARPSDLAYAWERLRAEEPGVRAREAARKLCTSEAELVASACGTRAVRLDPHFGALVEGLGALGDVMALTRNEADGARCRSAHHGFCHEPRGGTDPYRPGREPAGHGTVVQRA
ncbi:MAG: ChuX/HutX family heme-like substrate-binding protein [bacterium]